MLGFFALIFKCFYFTFSFNSTSDAIESMTPIDMTECSVDRSNTLTFKIILMMGAVFVTISALISLYINKVDRKKLLSKKMTTVHRKSMLKSIFFIYFSHLALDLFRIFRIYFPNTAFLCDGNLFYDIFELRSMRWNHKCDIDCHISHKHKVNTLN